MFTKITSAPFSCSAATPFSSVARKSSGSTPRSASAVPVCHTTKAGFSSTVIRLNSSHGSSGEIRIGRPSRAGASPFQGLIPRQQPRSPYHSTNPGGADEDLEPRAAGKLDPYEVPGKRQKHAQAENFERMLSAQDR